ncbi:hypothetical protein DKT74_36330, partial [Streptomyces sp. ZEA17I]|uniref:hypothetical protein n=1 Tax=Streptomyces sp. ZEA17I TaxID=2202516 RepID=UPI000D8F759A
WLTKLIVDGLVDGVSLERVITLGSALAVAGLLQGIAPIVARPRQLCCARRPAAPMLSLCRN